MAKVNYGWLKTYNDEYFAPKTILSQLHTDEGTLLEDFLDNSYLKLSEGGELEGPLLLAKDPEVDKEAATKKYVDEAVSTVVYSQEISEDGTSEITFSDVDDIYGYLVYYNGILLTLGKNYIIIETNTISLLDWTANAGDLITISGKQSADNNQNSIFMASTLVGLTASIEELNYTDGVTSSIQTQLDNKAPLVSPVLTGTPTAPTAAVDTNTTQIATTAFVTNAVSNLTNNYFIIKNGQTTYDDIESIWIGQNKKVYLDYNELLIPWTGAKSETSGSTTVDGETLSYINPILDFYILNDIYTVNRIRVTGNYLSKTVSFDINNYKLSPISSPAFTGTPTAPTAAAGTNTTQIATTAFVQTAINNAIIAAMEASY